MLTVRIILIFIAVMKMGNLNRVGGENDCIFNFEGRCTNPKITRGEPGASGKDYNSRIMCTHTQVGAPICGGYRQEGMVSTGSMERRRRYLALMEDGDKNGDYSCTEMYDWVMNTAAWRSMKPGPRALYLELKRIFNGKNNGLIAMGVGSASKLLSVSSKTVTGYFEELMRRGFIKQVPAKINGDSLWELTEVGIHGNEASAEFILWR